MILPEQKLDALVTRLKTIETELAAGPERDTYVRLSREFSELQPLVQTITAYRATEGEIADLDAMLADATTDPEMRALAESEKPALEAKRAELAQKIRVALIPKDAMDERNVILEIRAGTGGDRPRCSPATCSACTSAMRRSTSGRSNWSRRAKARSAASRKSSPRSRAAAPSPS